MSGYQIILLCFVLFSSSFGLSTKSDNTAHSQECLPGCLRFQDRCYFMQDDSVQLPAYGELLCQKLMPNPLLKDKTTLAKISNKAQNDFLHKRLSGTCANIGGSDASEEGTWKFSDGQQMDYFNWAKQPWIQPDNGQRHTAGRENCIEMWEDGSWNDLMCRKDSGPRDCVHVCSYDLAATDISQNSAAQFGLKDDEHIQKPVQSKDSLESEIQRFAKAHNLSYDAGGELDVNQVYREYEDSMGDNWENVTLLHAAVIEVDEPAVKALVLHPDTNVNAAAEFGRTALHLVAGSWNREIIEDLLSRKDLDVINKKDVKGNAPLHEASFLGDERLIKLLLADSRTSPSITDNDGKNAVHLAAQHGKIGAVRVLTQDGRIDPSVKDKERRSAFHYGAENGASIVNILLEDGRSDPSLKDAKEDSALHLAAMRGETEVVKILLEDGRLNPTDKNLNGRTPMDIASKFCLSGRDCSGVVALLEKKL